MPEPKNLLVDVWLLSALGTALVADELADSPLSVDEFAVYGLVHDLGPVTATRLAGWTGLPLTTLSAMIRRCQDRGDLTRTQDASDRRNTLIALTELGMSRYRAALPALNAALERLVAQLDVPVAQARSTLQEIDAALRASLDQSARPYRVSDNEHVDAVAAEFELSPTQSAELHQFARWLRHRDATPT